MITHGRFTLSTIICRCIMEPSSRVSRLCFRFRISATRQKGRGNQRQRTRPSRKHKSLEHETSTVALSRAAFPSFATPRVVPVAQLGLAMQVGRLHLRTTNSIPVANPPHPLPRTLPAITIPKLAGEINLRLIYRTWS